MNNLLENIEDICLFIISGFAIFTVLNPNTGNRYTFRIVKAKDKDLYFVSVLTGSDNTSSYTYLGTIFGEKGYYHGKKSRISRDAQSAKVFSWFFEKINWNQSLGPVQVFHNGRCGRCGRNLTTPESIKTGIGPICREKVLG